jgi:hypothetical protein
MNIITWFYESKVTEKGIRINLLFNLIPMFNFPINRIKSVCLMSNEDLIGEDLRKLRFFAVRGGNRRGKVLVVQTTSWIFRWIYITPQDVQACYNLLKRELENRGSVSEVKGVTN